MDGRRESVEDTNALASAEITALDVLDHEQVEWPRVRRTAFLIHQHFRYDYPGPIEDLNHRLVIIPPERHLDQRRVVHRLDVSSEEAEVVTSSDSFGNTVLSVHVPTVEDRIDFEAWIVVERRSNGLTTLDTSALDRRWIEPSIRTEPDDALRTAALDLQAHGEEDIGLARRINHWVYERMRYAHDITDIHTSAAEALSLGRGVCQDYAHIMIALCRLCEIPARYVSGHLLGEGGTHAWVEVLLPFGEQRRVRVWPFDPTHGREPGLTYVTVATGRDYGDVAPTSGTFRASFRGELTSRKRVGLTAVEYSPGE
jgi:transglutaminase-like putative cysteine protease